MDQTMQHFALQPLCEAPSCPTAFHSSPSVCRRTCELNYNKMYFDFGKPFIFIQLAFLSHNCQFVSSHGKSRYGMTELWNSDLSSLLLPSLVFYFS